MEQKIFIEPVLSVTYTLQKSFFAAVTFQGLWTVSVQTVKKLVVWSGLYESFFFFTFLEKGRQNKYFLCELNLVFHM